MSRPARRDVCDGRVQGVIVLSTLPTSGMSGAVRGVPGPLPSSWRSAARPCLAPRLNQDNSPAAYPPIPAVPADAGDGRVGPQADLWWPTEAIQLRR